MYFSGPSAKTSPKEEEAKPVCANDKDQVVAQQQQQQQQQQQPEDQSDPTATTTTTTADASIVSSSSSFFSSAWNKMGEITKYVWRKLDCFVIRLVIKMV